MIVAEPGERERLRGYAILLTLGFWGLHLLLVLARGPWLPVPIESVSGRQAVVTLSGLLLCAAQYSIIERLPARRFAAIAAILLSCAVGAGLLNGAAPIAVHFLETGNSHPDAEPARFLSIAAYWTWVFLAWSSMIVALGFALKASPAFADAPAGAPSDGSADLWLPDRGQLVRVKLDDVVRIEAAGDYVVIHTADRHLLAHDSMRSLEQRLDGSEFARVHRGAIVRLREVVQVERGPTGLLQLRLSNGDVVQVSRSRRRRIGERLAAP